MHGAFITELCMGLVDPRVGLSWVRSCQFLQRSVGLVQFFAHINVFLEGNLANYNGLS